jgi:LuxR family maltose regulon positive regulatory protein
LVELRVADLRFSLEETADFLKQIICLDLSADDILALETRTEGWAAGLQMAALAIRKVIEQQPNPPLQSASRQPEIHHFIQAFSGSHRFILDYLGEEVLNQRSEDVRRFLLCTSILKRLSGPLCDAVTEGTRSQAVLQALEKENLFMVKRTP